MQHHHPKQYRRTKRTRFEDLSSAQQEQVLYLLRRAFGLEPERERTERLATWAELTGEEADA